MKSENGDHVFDFEKLEVYQLSLELLDRIFIVCRSLPRDLHYSVGDQLMRAGLSISNNLAEGVGKRSRKERAQYYGTALNSARECISMFIVLRRQSCISEEVYSELRGQGRRITAMLYGLIGSLERHGTPVHQFTRTPS